MNREGDVRGRAVSVEDQVVPATNIDSELVLALCPILIVHGVRDIRTRIVERRELRQGHECDRDGNVAADHILHPTAAQRVYRNEFVKITRNYYPVCYRYSVSLRKQARGQSREHQKCDQYENS